MGNCPTCQSELAEKSVDPLCHGERMWSVFLLSSIVVLFLGWIIILICRLIHRLFVKYRQKRLENVIFPKKKIR